MKLKEILEKAKPPPPPKIERMSHLRPDVEEVIDRAMDFVAKRFGISKEEALRNAADYLFGGDISKLKEETAYVLSRRVPLGLNEDDEAGHLIHEATEATVIKQIWGRVIPPQPNWEETVYYKTAHPVAARAEIEFLELVRRKDLAERRRREYAAFL